MSLLWRTARTLGARRRGRKALPPLLFFTDPDRTPDPIAVAQRLPRGAGVVFRGFGRPGAADTAQALAAVARRRGLVLLVGADIRLAKACGAAGVHLPERDARKVGKARQAGLRLVTVAAHSTPALIRARPAGADAAVLSAVFPSRSPSAGRALGVVRFEAMARRAGLPVYALGGVTPVTARRLIGGSAAGVAAVDAFRT